jgi:hypothetical protein
LLKFTHDTCIHQHVTQQPCQHLFVCFPPMPCIPAGSFSLRPPTFTACDGLASTCYAHTVVAGQTLEQIAALHGTTTWQILLDNNLLAAVGPTGMVPLRPYDVLAVRPSPGAEALRWQWTRNECAALPLLMCNLPASVGN